MTALILQGEKVILRPKQLSDLANDYRWRTDEELAQLDATKPLKISFEEFAAISEAEYQHPFPWSRRFAIETLNHKHIGNCMHYDADYIRGQTELGILIGERDYWQRGFGSDAVNTLVHHIFTNTPLAKVYLHTLEWNHRAHRAFEKCGFNPIKNVRRGSRAFVYMEILKRDWLQRQRDGANDGVHPAPPSS